MQKRNILAKRLPEIKDLPYNLKLSIFGRGSLMGEEDVLSRQKFSCTLKCYSSKGTVYELPREQFFMLRTSE
jgi:CRP-like cAMP-binding protein